MNIMPMSYYPMPSDENSQMNVLTERRAETNEKIENVQQSKMGSAQKQTVTDHLEQDNDAIRGEMIQQEVQKDQKKQQADAQRTRQEQKTADLEKQDKKRKSFDLRA